MTSYIIRRVLAAVLVVIAASFIVYILAAYSKDPLEELRVSSDPNKEQLIATRIELLQLDIPPVLRYFTWLGGILGFLWGAGTFGNNIESFNVADELSRSLGSTLTLVSAATVLAIIIGIAVGMTAALRQYSGYDYTITFLMFVLYSLPVFWIAVLLKQYVAIGFNDFLRDPNIEPQWIILLALISGFIFMNIFGGSLKNRGIVFGGATLVTAAVLIYINLTDWFSKPHLGIVLFALIGIGIATLVTVLSTGLKNRRVWYLALAMVGVGVALYYPVMNIFYYWQDPLMFLTLALLTWAISFAAGWFFGGDDRAAAIRTSMVTATLVGFTMIVDRFLQAWSVYTANPKVGNRPIATAGAYIPNLEGSMWVHMVDSFTHLLLPTLALLLISLAAYTRYSRASLLEVLNQDYVRTARAKGLPERTVIMRHAFRNALIPVATVIAFDIGGLIGGAVITERIFSWNGMGRMFLDNLDQMDLNPVMAFFLVTGLIAILFNLIADFAYAALDPRIRVK